MTVTVKNFSEKYENQESVGQLTEKVEMKSKKTDDQEPKSTGQIIKSFRVGEIIKENESEQPSERASERRPEQVQIQRENKDFDSDKFADIVVDTRTAIQADKGKDVFQLKKVGAADVDKVLPDKDDYSNKKGSPEKVIVLPRKLYTEIVEEEENIKKIADKAEEIQSEKTEPDYSFTSTSGREKQESEAEVVEFQRETTDTTSVTTTEMQELQSETATSEKQTTPVTTAATEEVQAEVFEPERQIIENKLIRKPITKIIKPGRFVMEKKANSRNSAEESETKEIKPITLESEKLTTKFLVKETDEDSENVQKLGSLDENIEGGAKRINFVAPGGTLEVAVFIF